MIPIAAIPAIATTALGAYQLLKSRNDAERPQMGIPTGVTSALNLAQRLASSTELPGQSAMEQNIERNYQSGLETAKGYAPTSVSVLGAVSDLTDRLNVAQNELDRMAAENYAANQRNLMGQQNLVGQYQQQAWEWNKAQPYMQKYQEQQNLRGAGLQNIMGGASNLGNTLMMDRSQKQYYNFLKNWYSPTKQESIGTEPGYNDYPQAPPTETSLTPWGNLANNNPFSVSPTGSDNTNKYMNELSRILRLGKNNPISKDPVYKGAF